MAGQCPADVTRSKKIVSPSEVTYTAPQFSHNHAVSSSSRISARVLFESWENSKAPTGLCVPVAQFPGQPVLIYTPCGIRYVANAQSAGHDASIDSELSSDNVGFANDPKDY